ncbi:MAG: TatD family hydrolase [Methanomassiliicoccales archaeon]
MQRIPIFDNHLHLSPEGRNVEAVKEFVKEGGTHFILCHLPYASVPINKGEDFLRSYEITLQLGEKCRKEAEVGVDIIIGPYPVLLLDLAKKHGLSEAMNIMRQGMELAQSLVREGKAVGIGEIGRPHFPVSEEIMEASNELMSYGMQLAKEASCPVILHTESATPSTMLEIARMADRVGLPREKVVKHYSPPLVKEEENSGLFPSILASRMAMTEALSKGKRFLVETDYLDDPKRPGAVMSITTVPKRTKALLKTGIMSEEQAYAIHQENPGIVYGITVRC